VEERVRILVVEVDVVVVEPSLSASTEMATE
jgi:hypothetical protein